MKIKYFVVILLLTALKCLGQSNTQQVVVDSEDIGKVPRYECNYFKETLFSSIRAKSIRYDYLLPNEYTVIHTACLCGDVELIRLLLEFKVNINLKDKEGNTPLMYACSKGYKEIIELLISRGAKVNVKNKQGYTAILKAIVNDKNGLFDFYFSKYVEKGIYNPKKSAEWLTIAIASGNLFVVKKLVPYYNIEDTTLFDEPLLVNASRFAANYNQSFRQQTGNPKYIKKTPTNLDIDIMDELLKQGADLNKKDYNGNTILVHVIEDYPVIQFLVTKGIKVNQLNNEKSTFLKVLIEKIIKPDEINFNGNYFPLKDLDRDYSEDFNMIKYLIEHGAIVNKGYQNGWTYLILESLKSKKGLIVEKLINAESSIFVKDNSGKSAIDYAIEYGDEDSKIMLKKLLIGR